MEIEIVLKATLLQKNKLEGVYKNIFELKFIKCNNYWICPADVIEDNAFEEIREQLKLLPQIEYKPILEENAS